MNEIAQRIRDSGAIKHGTFQLSDETLTDYYIDKYVFETQPTLLEAVRDALVEHLDVETCDILAGPALGAVPLVTAVSLQTNINSVFIRKSRGLQGTQARIEGDVDKGMRAVVIEDVTMTGKTAVESAQVLESAGVVVDTILAVVDRDEGAEDTAHKAGYDFEPVICIGDDILVDDRQ
ncbi:orotate phosphoribosyltransferase [Halegenticoccus tardaugens]|uniref:orotate phosphoribosyltransferase n=1 Tax=Halegenticoccus tardaugens TaxID=2071624 RepID=UPI00100A521B|nr:orotate phosphoribosyltransferase [Halegenticoccus tardaugens]